MEIYYYRVVAALKNLQQKKLKMEKQYPTKLVSYSKLKIFFWQNWQIRKSEKLVKQINDGYYAGVKDALKVVNKIYKEMLKE